MFRMCCIACWLLVAGLPGMALAQRESMQPLGQLPKAFEGVGLDEKLGTTIPTTLTFADETGAAVTLDRYLGGEKPVLLHFVYHNCPMLCNLILDNLTRTLKEMDWTPGQQFELVTVSFSAIETPDLAARQKAKYLAQLGNPDAAAGWHFLTGDQAALQSLTDALGFRYKWIPQAKEYAHPAALMFLSPEGKVTRYLYGMEFPPEDVRRALLEASEGTVGTPLDQFIMYCLQYDATLNTYVLNAERAMKLGGGLTVLVLGLLLVVLWRRERQRQQGFADIAPMAS
jgi:protein SCO1/2